MKINNLIGGKLVEILTPDKDEELGLVFEVDGDRYTVFVDTDEIVYQNDLLEEIEED